MRISRKTEEEVKSRTGIEVTSIMAAENSVFLDFTGDTDSLVLTAPGYVLNDPTDHLYGPATGEVLLDVVFEDLDRSTAGVFGQKVTILTNRTTLTYQFENMERTGKPLQAFSWTDLNPEV